ncbi:MAG: hypothetical protein Q8J97_16510, partial [Flavobacteriaceae bacterium]|nr:hypothetical protein [Flavobacteriaceae bacterium]
VAELRAAASSEVRVAKGEMDALRAELESQTALVARLERRAEDAERTRVAPAVHREECEALRTKLLDAERHADLLQRRLDHELTRAHQQVFAGGDAQRSAEMLAQQLQRQLDLAAAENTTLMTTISALQKQLHFAAVRSVEAGRGGELFLLPTDDAPFNVDRRLGQEQDRAFLAEAAEKLLLAANEVDALRSESDALRQQVEALERRVRESNHGPNRSLSLPRRF